MWIFHSLLAQPYLQANAVLNTLRLRQNGRHFPDNIFKCIFLNENIQILIKISVEFVPKDPINNIASLVQIMAWHQPSNKPLSEQMIVYWCIYASLSLSGLRGLSVAFDRNCGNSHWSHMPTMHCSLLWINCQWGSPQSIFRPTNHAVGNTRRSMTMSHSSTALQPPSWDCVSV